MQHVPGFIAQAEQLKAKGVDEILLISVATRRPRRRPTKITDHRAAVTAARGARVELPQTKSTATLFIFEHIASAQKFYKKLRQDLIIKLT